MPKQQPRWRWTETRLRRLQEAIARFNAVNNAAGNPLQAADFDNLVPKIKGRQNFNRALRALNSATPQNLTEKVNFRGVEVSRYQRQQILNQMQSININKKIRLQELEKVISARGGSHEAMAEVEILKHPVSLPVKFETQQAFIKFQESLTKATYRNLEGDFALIRNFFKAVDENLTVEDARRVKERISAMNPRDFYNAYIVEGIEIGYVYGPISSAEKVGGIERALDRYEKYGPKNA